MRTIAARRLMPMGWAVRYLYEDLSSNRTTYVEESRSGVPEHAPTSIRVDFLFVQYGLRLLRPRYRSCRDYLMREDRPGEIARHTARDVESGWRLQ